MGKAGKFIDDHIETALTGVMGIAAGTAIGIAGWAGYSALHAHDNVPPTLVPITVGSEKIKVPGSTFSNKNPNTITTKEKDEKRVLPLQKGVNKIKLKCDTYEAEDHTYTFSDASGKVTVGQPVDSLGGRDDIHVSRPNGEELMLEHHCDGGSLVMVGTSPIFMPNEDNSTVYIDISR